MPAATLMSVGEYLRTPFPGPEPDYVDGILVERSLPNRSHGRIIRNLVHGLLPWDQREELIFHFEIRLQVAPGRFRVADFACFAKLPLEEVPEHAPFLIVEVLSPGDPHDELVDRLSDYQTLGVPYIFAASPMAARLSRYLNGSLIGCPALEIAEYGIQIPLSEIFK